MDDACHESGPGRRRGRLRVVDQDLKGFACAGVGGPAEADGFVLARGLSDGRGAALGSGLLDVGGPVQDGANLGEDLTQVDVLTDARQGQPVRDGPH